MQRLWRCAFVLALAAVAGGSLSGLYIDNGLDQTMIHRAMSDREKQVMELEILNLLGIGERPRRVRAAPLDRSAPSFLLDVYKSLAEERDQTRPTRSSELSLSGEELHAIDESDIIMTFQSKKHHMEVLRHEHGRHVWFDVSEVPEEQTLVGAELRLYQAPDYSGQEPNAIYSVAVQKVVSVDSYGGLVMEEAMSANTSASSEGWLELNVTQVFASWVALPHTNKGFFITVHPHRTPEVDLKPEDIGIVDVRGVDGKRPFMVAFYKASPKIRSGADDAASAASRRKRAANKRRRLPGDHGYSENYVRNPLTDSSHWTTRSCQIQTLYVSFKDLEWQDWIIAPDGYGAFYCSGECNFPLNAHMNATNHAIVQTLVHLLNPNKVPKPCCAPTKLTPLAVLYFADDSNVILRKYKNMVVKSCGCH